MRGLTAQQRELLDYLSPWARRVLWFSRSVTSDSLRPHGLQHTRLPCPSPSPGVAKTHIH